MAPHLGHGVQTDHLGKFVITVPPKKRVLMAMDRERQRGGIVFLDPDKEDAHITIQLQSLVQVKGSYRFPDLQLDWTFTQVRIRDVDNAVLLVCGSFNRDFSIKLPPRAYVIEGYGESERLESITDHSRKDITLSSDDTAIDVGVLELKPGFVLQSKLAGRWGNLADYYGKEPPKWHIADARGLPKNTNVTDFKGKWLLVEFWSPSCGPCVATSLPELASFYEQHKADRQRFEIVAFCCDPETEDVGQLYKNLKAVVEKAWKGKELPFPLVLDSERRTQESYGISLYPTLLLIDPDGRLVEGGSLGLLKEELWQVKE